ncbi:hypothetical protein RJT34_13023 [Clitoria ternatea]|uniref:Cation/H+ exchanger domain-containing protein n=1 Tax=Clitoria ternatea TaxID=43366 RepID=A0AAN9JN64_CLITE
MSMENNHEERRLAFYQNIVDNPNPIWKSENILRLFLPQFTFLMVYIIFSTRSIHYILRPLNQPHFVAELLAGLLLQTFRGTILYDLLAPAKALLGIETIAHIGLIFNMFLTGLEMNLCAIMQARKKATSVAIVGTILPMVIGGLVYDVALTYSKEENTNRFNTNTAHLFCASLLSVTNFPVLAHILSDLKILYTGLGRVALAAATVSDFYNWATFVWLIPFSNGSRHPFVSVFWTMFFVVFCFFAVRPSLGKFLVKKTEKNEWDNYQLSFVVIGVLLCAHVTEMLGTHSIIGALICGLILPRGKFADMVIEKSDDVVSVYLAPLFFISVGVRFKLTIFLARNLLITAAIVLLSCSTKIISTVIATSFYHMPLRDGVALGALMNPKGILPLIMLNIASDKQIFDDNTYSALVLSVLIMTMTVSPIINHIYKPRKRFEKGKLRTIQNLKADTEVRVLVAVHNCRQATGMINILQAFCAANLSPLRVFILHLMELKGRDTAILNVQLEQNHSNHEAAEVENIASIFAELAAEASNTSNMEALTAVSPYETIHKDIYNIAEEKIATLVLLPFHKHASTDGTLEITDNAFKDINQNVMRHAPCSVGILVDRGHGSLSNVKFHIAMLFIGGPDDREALAIAWRMARHEGTHLSMVRILLCGKAAEVDSHAPVHDENQGLLSTVLDSGKEKMLDEEYVSLFRLMAVNNEDSVTYAERQVHTGDEVSLVLDELDKNGYDLYVLGQGKGRNSLVLSSLLEWTDCPELGVIGDMLASNSCGSSSSVLVVQQYGFGGTDFKTSNQGNANNEDVESLFGKRED